jgi:DNA-binding IclR family transcriptional regulator
MKYIYQEEEMEQKNPIQVAGRLFGALEFLADAGSAGLMEVSEALGLNKTTAHRVLNSLIYMGYAKQNAVNGRYEPTFKVVDIANRIMGKVDIVQIVRPYLRKLMEATGETVHFVERDGIDAVYIDKVESLSNGIQMVSRIGSRIPLYCSGVGKTMVAEMDEWEIEEIWNNSEIIRLTPYTITDHDDFKMELDEIRRRGYALDNEENETGVRCIACSLKEPAGGARHAFSISAPVSRMDNDRIRELADSVLKVREEIAEKLRS